MDSIDVQILALLQQDGRMPVSELSKALNLSRPSISERLRRLEERQIIQGFTARVSPAAVGRTVLVIIEIGQLTVACHTFEEHVSHDRDILECHRVTGSVSYIIKAAVPSMAHLEELVDRLIPYGRLNTSVVLSSPVEHRPVLPTQPDPR